MFILLLSLAFLTSCAQSSLDDVGNSSSEVSSNSPVSETSSVQMPSSKSVSGIKYTDDELLEQLANGDYSNAEFEEDDDEKVYKKYYKGGKEGYRTWIKFDVNDDGADELVLQDNELGLITAIFSVESSKITCRYLDEVEMMRGYFISKSEKLMSYYYNYGVFCCDSYSNGKFNEDWKFEKINALTIYDIYSMEELPDYWLKENPEMNKVGVYRFQTRYEKNEKGELIEKKETVSQEAFEKEFEALMGVPFSQMPPDWYK